MKGDLFCREKLVAALKRIKNNKASGDNSLVNNFFKLGDYKVRNKSMRIIRFETEKVPSDFRTTLIQVHHNKGDKNEWYYSGNLW